MDDPSARADLTWSNVFLALSFVLFDTVLSSIYQLGISRSLVVSAFRCVVQLTIMGLVLQNIFETKSPWGVAGLACKSNFDYLSSKDSF
jgi:ABC-type iron transport system FetAB permease component